MNKNILIVLAGGFLIAVLVAILLQSMLNGSSKDKNPEENRVQILVAAKDLKVGRELKEGDLKWQNWPKDTAFMGAIVRDGEQVPLDAAQGKLLRSLVKGQPMHMSLIVEEDKGNFLSANVQKGMRAVGISVKAHVLAGRLIRPGDFVDVMVTYRVRVNTRNNPEAKSLVNRYATETVIENIRVLAIDNNDVKAVDEEDDGKKKKKKKSTKKASLTLEVLPSDAEKLVLADKMGDIGLALRSIGDVQDPKTPGATTDVGLSKVMTKLSSMSGVGPKSSVVRIYNGEDMQEVRTRGGDVEENGVQFNVEESPEEYEINQRSLLEMLVGSEE